ncbi:MAG: hypothetical protein WA777_15175 [Rhodanobacter sp.]
MFDAIKTRLLLAFGNWAIQRAMRTPYLHLYHDDGRPYMERYWLFRIGQSRQYPDEDSETCPLFSIRVHRIVSSDDRTFHDHPWNYTTLILRGGYTEVTPRWGIIQPYMITMADDYDGHDPCLYNTNNGVRYEAGSVLRRKADNWHFLELNPGEEAWTMFIMGPKRQDWGFLVDGLVKVFWRDYLARREARSQQASA